MTEKKRWEENYPERMCDIEEPCYLEVAVFEGYYIQKMLKVSRFMPNEVSLEMCVFYEFFSKNFS